MKTTPTETDREAAQLFKPAQGMRARVEERPGVEAWATVCDECTVFLEWTRYSSAEANVRALGQVMAIDTDDPATVGVMLAQVEAALDAVGRPGAYLHPWEGGWAIRRGAAIRRYPGATKGAALVAAMKALKGAT